MRNRKLWVLATLFTCTLQAQAQQRAALPETIKSRVAEVLLDSDTRQENYSFKDGHAATASPSRCALKTDERNLPYYDIELQHGSQSQYSVCLQWKVGAAVSKGDVMLARLSMRTISARQESGESVVYAYFQERHTPYTKSFVTQIGAGREWKTFDLPFVAHKDFTSGEAVFELALGSLAQHVEVCGVQILNFKEALSVDELPVTRFSYAGRETDALWRQKALQRIEEIRTAPLTIQVVNAAGKPVKGAVVEAVMQQSDFLWGTAVNESALSGDRAENDLYRKHLKELFNTAVIENGMKAGGWAWDINRKANTLRSFEWLDRNGFRQRGHNLVWPAWKFNPSITKEIALTDTALFNRFIKAQFYERMAYTKHRVVAWDVVNEPMHEKEFFAYLPKDIMVEWYKLAQRLDPEAQLFINDYAMLNCVQSPQNISEYIDTIEMLRKKGAPIGGIGVQGHIGRQPRNPEQVLADLDLFIPTRLPVQITEFDINTPDEELQADYTRDFLIAVYSHPSVTGVILWGFWEAHHWKPDAGMFRKDWTPKPNAAVWREWVTGRWKTHVKQSTDRKGTACLRGHLGSYKVRVTYNNTVKEVDCHLEKSGSELLVTL